MNTSRILMTAGDAGDLRAAIGARLPAIASDCGIVFGPADTVQLDRAMQRTRWLAVDPAQAVLQCFEDQDVPASWIEIAGLTAIQMKCLSAALQDAASFVSFDRLMADARTHASRGALLRAVIAREPQALRELAGLANQGLAAQEPDHRFEAAAAASLLQDGSLRVPLAEAAAEEVDEGVRRAIAIALDQLPS